MFNDSREPLIEVAIQLLIVVLDYDMEQQQIIDNVNNPDTSYEVPILFSPWLAWLLDLVRNH